MNNDRIPHRRLEDMLCWTNYYLTEALIYLQKMFKNKNKNRGSSRSNLTSVTAFGCEKICAQKKWSDLRSKSFGFGIASSSHLNYK